MAKQYLETLALVTGLLVGSLGSSGRADEISQRDLEAFVQITRQLLEERLNADELAKTRRHILVVFVPGLAGSKLTRGSKVIWGKGSPNGRDLRLDDPLKSDVVPEILEEFPVFAGFGEDPYRMIVDVLNQAMDAEGAGPLQTFAYDWRLDIDSSTDALHEYLTHRDRRDKTLILVGHSLGGLLAWQWHVRKYTADTPVTLARLLVVGAPLAGSCEIMRLLTQGTVLPRDSPWHKRWFARVAFRKVRDAALTFPSLFEILPDAPSLAWPESYRMENTCVELMRPGTGRSSDAPDLKRPEFWFDTSFGRKLLREPWNGLDWNPEEFRARFGRVLTVAASFTVRRDPLIRKVPVTYVFASDIPTLKKMQVIGGADKDSPIEAQRELLELGDGRILPQVARNEPGGLCENGPEMSCQTWYQISREDWIGGDTRPVDHADAVDVMRVSLGHGQLPQAAELVAYLKAEISELHTSSEATANLKAILRHGLLTELSQRLDSLGRRERAISLSAVTDAVQIKLGNADDFVQLESQLLRRKKSIDANQGGAFREVY